MWRATLSLTQGVFAIFTKLPGSMVGLVLVLYGTLNLGLEKMAVGSPVRQVFCQLLLCPPANTDSPGAVDATPDLPVIQARLALLLDPASAYRWADLAQSEINTGHVNSAKFCIRQALASAPGNPAILFHAANFDLRLQDYPETLRNLLSVLRNPDLSAFYGRVFTLYSQMDLPLSDLLSQGLPHSPEAANGFLRFWINQNKLDEASETWSWINKNSLTSLPSAGSYAALLGKSGKWDDALLSWTQNTAQLDAAYTKTNWIYNGSFELPLVESPFDWHLNPKESIPVVRDTESGYKGSASLRLKFLDTPRESSPAAYQLVVLTPGDWQIKAAVKTLDLTGGQGVVLRVVDAGDPVKLDAATNSFTHTQEWTTVSQSFRVGSDTHLARVEIIRPPAGDLGIPVTGTVWIDAVTLAPVP